MNGSPTPRGLPCQAGFAFLWLLFLVAGLGVALAAVGVVWHASVQREREQELLFVGDQYRRAIESFWRATPGEQKRLPRSLEELVQDPRFPNTLRHLRRVYRDPMTGTAEWGLVRGQDGGIAGVYSLHEGVPYKSANFPAAYRHFAERASYRDWVFLFDAAPGAGQPPAAEADAAGKAGPARQGPDAGSPGMTSPAGKTAPATGSGQDDPTCVEVQASNHEVCAALLQEGDNEGWRECINEARAEFMACLQQRQPTQP